MFRTSSILAASVVIVILLGKDTNGLKIFLVDKDGNPKDVNSFGNNSSFIHGESFQDISCVGDGPLEWVYEGGGKPSKVKELSRRRVDDKVKSIIHFAVVNSSYDYVLHTGRYICRLLLQPQVNSSIYVHFRGDENVPPLIDGSSTSGILYLPNPNVSSTVVVPCLSTSPSTIPKLFRLAQGNITALEEPYDPLTGFKLSIPSEGDPLDTVVGEYACSIDDSGNKSIRYLLYPSTSAKVSPSDTILYVGKTINLTCEYSEPVLIKETESNLPVYDDDEDDMSVEEEIEETTETIPTSVHVANYIDTDPMAGSFGEFQCVTDSPEKRVLHTWKYFVIGKEADELSGIKYNKKKEEFRCRSKVNQPGLLSFIHCATPSECQINRICLEKSDSCRGYKAPLKKPNHCKSGNGTPCTKIVYNGGSGYIRCVGEGIEQIRSFGDRGSLRMKEEFRRALNLTLNDVTMEPNALIFNVTLDRSSYHFIEGHRWSISYVKGSSETRRNITASERKISRDAVAATIRIPVDSYNSVKINCLVPLRNSMEWEKLTLTIQQSDLPDLSIVEDTERSTEQNNEDITTEATVTEHSVDVNDGNDLYTTTSPTDVLLT